MPCASRRSARPACAGDVATARSKANILARSRWRYTTPRLSAVVTVTPSTVHSRNHRESWVGTLSCGRSWCAGSALVKLCSTPRRSRIALPGGVLGSPTRPDHPRRRRQFGRGRQDHRVGVFPAESVHLRQGRLQDGEDVLGAGEEVVHRLVLNGDGRILKAQEMFQRRLQMAADQATHVAVPVQRRDHQPIAQVEVGLPVDGVVLVAPRHVPDRGARHGDRGIAVLGGPQPVVGVVPLDEQRQRLAQFVGDRARDHAHPPAVVVDVDAAVQQLAVGISVVQRLSREVVVVLGMRRVGPHEVAPADHLAHHVQVRTDPEG